jgi:hypothetical protein
MTSDAFYITGVAAATPTQ